jgi:ubiquinone/menaquinone biosynthesis C-methylase UbiE
MVKLEEINRLTRETYDRAGSRYHELFKHELEDKEYDREVLDEFAISLGDGAIVYDVGCGPCGHTTRYLRDRGLQAVGIDISPECVAIASREHPDIEFIEMDMMTMDLEDESIDGILAYYSIIHTPKTYVNQVFQEFRRVLRRGGRLFVTVKEGADEGILDSFLECPARVYFTNFQSEEIRGYFESNGFRIELLETRRPYLTEIQVSRIYAIGERS